MTRNDRKDLGCDWQLFRQIVKTVFNQRRKMLRVSLKQLMPGFKSDEDFFMKRPEQLTHEEFVWLTNYVEKLRA
jgi:16S rRNA (adenine1518-N6/adenine1519-N6)-dimethyltransferase